MGDLASPWSRCDSWTPKVAAERVAYLTFPAFLNNSVCVEAAALK